MIRAAIGFFILASIAYVFGTGNIAGISQETGQSLMGLFLVLSALFVLAYLFSDSARPRNE